MANLSIDFRPARPEDVRAAVPLIYSSGPHEFDYVYRLRSKPAQDYLHFAFPTGKGLSSFHLCTVALVDNEVAGICAFQSGRDNLTTDLGNAANFWRFFGWRHFGGVVRRGLQMTTVLPPPDKDTAYLSQVGVRPDLRGRGVGSALLKNQMARARSAGFRRCALDVAATNPRAEALYERLGFRFVRQRDWKYGAARGPVPHQRRMEIVF
ncbi:GNAT family N-acetyltransferase [Larkinella soli]|uniref:GNAT family N-acetyltransferase n=1 Tax=Larkinella soli TaxID=1770527 RepID=UPI0013E3B24A|nr:GNAT family N-acetyltransferase [Larkinella soli]